MRPLVKSTPIEERKAFEEFILPHVHDLRKYCTSLSKTTWDGDDLMQETLAKAYKDWLKKQNPIAKAYLYRIASNTWIDGYRKRKLTEELSPDLSEKYMGKENVLPDATYKVMGFMLKELTPKQRIAVLLADAFGYTAKEISQMIDTSQGAIKAALHRARRKMKQVNYADDFPIFNTEEDEALTYVTALRNGDPVSIVRLYQNEIMEPQMAEIRFKGSIPCSVIQFLASSGSSYVLVTIPLENGAVMYIPFYQMELVVLLSRMAELENDISVAA